MLVSLEFLLFMVASFGISSDNHLRGVASCSHPVCFCFPCLSLVVGHVCGSAPLLAGQPGRLPIYQRRQAAQVEFGGC